MEHAEATWRDSSRPVRVGLFDARLLVLLVVWIFVPSLTTTALLLVAAVLFRAAEARGYRFRAALRLIRARLAGRRHALCHFRRRRFTDFG